MLDLVGVRDGDVGYGSAGYIIQSSRIIKRTVRDLRVCVYIYKAYLCIHLYTICIQRSPAASLIILLDFL